MTDTLTAMLTACHDEHTSILRDDVAQLDMGIVVDLFNAYQEMTASDDPFTAVMAEFALAGLVGAYLSSMESEG